MNPDVKQKWVAALRSGEYEQGRDQLVTSEGAYCCLGVLCELARAEGVVTLDGGTYVAVDNPDDREDLELPSAVEEWAGLYDYEVRWGDMTAKVTTLNDGGLGLSSILPQSFPVIADAIEASL